jgi:nucleoside diphosphate kinase
MLELRLDLANSGFTIVAEKTAVISDEQVDALYGDLRPLVAANGLGVYPYVHDFMVGGPCTMMILSKPAAVRSLLKLMGPDDPVEAKAKKAWTIRARYGTRLTLLIHGLRDLSLHIVAERFCSSSYFCFQLFAFLSYRFGVATSQCHSWVCRSTGCCRA